VRLRPDIIMTWDLQFAQQLKKATTTIPIVTLGPDPVANGLALSLARPGGNITGVFTQPEVSGKFLEFLRELDPRITKVGYLAPAQDWNTAIALKLREFAKNVGIALIGPALEFPMDDAEFRRVLAEMLAQHPDAVIISPSAENYAHRPLILENIAQARLPAMYVGPYWVREGGLMSYTPDTLNSFRRSAEYVDKIFRGASPGELPFQEATTHKLLLNLKTAVAIGVTFPPALLARADEVIE
jgi:putative tryptophan/tyrosine transport system substrate-binding protein